MQIEVKINQAEAIRRGHNAPHPIEKLEIDVSLLAQPQRDYIADNIREGNRLWSEYSNPEYPKPLPEPTMVGFLEMIDGRISLISTKKAEEEERELKEAEEHRAEQAQLKAELLSGVARFRDLNPDGTFRQSFGHAIYQEDVYLNSPTLGENRRLAVDPDIEPLIAVHQEAVAAETARRKLVKDQEEIQKRQAQAAMLARLSSYFTEEEAFLHKRGRLSVDSVRIRLECAALLALEQALDPLPRPPGYEGGEYSVLSGWTAPQRAKSTWNTSWVPTIRRIEEVCHHEVTGIYTDCIYFHTLLDVPYQDEPIQVEVVIERPEEEKED
jgi:hypothetical protein